MVDVAGREPAQVDGAWLGFTRSLFYPLTFSLAKTEIQQPANLPREGGAILVLNHITHIDPVYDAVFLDRIGRMPHFLAKHSLFEKPLVKRVMYRTGQIPVYRGTDRATDSLAAARAALEKGAVVIIYPEGTCTRDPEGWPMVPRNGVARLALETNAPVIPAARWGTRSIMNLYRKRFTPVPRSKVTMRFGEPLDLSEYRQRGHTRANLGAVTDLAMRSVRELLAEVRGETAPDTFYDPRGRERA